jgi:hypothetical protein
MQSISFPDNRPLRALPAEAIVDALDHAAERWRDADFPPRVRATAAIEERTGYTTPVVDYALDRLFGGITAEALRAAIVHELGSLAVLDRFVEVPGRPRGWARGVDRVTLVASDTTVGVAIPPLCYALCAKCGVVVKDRSDALVAAFVETLGTERRELARAVRVESWLGGADEREREVLGRAEVVVAFGGDEALRAIRAAAPAEATFVPFGHRLSAAYVTRADLAGELDSLAERIARDALLYDGEGCLSLHVLFVERGEDGARARLARALAGAAERVATEFPPGRDPYRAAHRRSATQNAAFLVAVGARPEHAEPFPVVTVDDLAAAARWVDDRAFPLLDIVIADPTLDPRALAETFGVVRVTAIGAMQNPPLAGHHGGRPRIAEFIRWTDYEP